MLPAWLLCLSASLFGLNTACAQTPKPDEGFALRLDGDIGLGVYYRRSIIRSKENSAVVLPYAYADFGRLFARIDTLGIKTLKLGYGHLELVGRVELDGFKTDTASLQGLNRRKNSLPLGVGSFQKTPLGGLFVYAFQDVNQSSGNLFDITYVGKAELPPFTLYPQAGIEYLSRPYVSYYYGVSAQEAAASRYAPYQPGGAFNPFIAAMLETKIATDWNLNLLVRHKWLAKSIQDSPIVGRSSMDNIVLSVAYRFK